MFKRIFGYDVISILLLLLLLPFNLFSMTCNVLNLPHECHCQPPRHTSLFYSNGTYIRCRQLTDITTNQHWSSISYDRLIFETFHDNLTLHRFAFADTIIRILRFNVQNLFFNNYTFENAHIGQLVISHPNSYGRINFGSHGQIFYGTTITNLQFQFIDFQTAISEMIFSNARIRSFSIHSSKFYGFTNPNLDIISQTIPKLPHDDFLDYDYSLSKNLTRIPRASEEFNATNNTYITIYTIKSSINTTNLTDNYFPNNLEYYYVEEIELTFNQITSLNAHVFRHLNQFQGRLILSNNQIKYIDPAAFVDLSSLKNLSLARNFIRDLSSQHFENLTQLNELDLSSNQIEILTNKTFEYLSNLQILYLNYNPLEFIQADTFTNLTQLKQIHFQGVQFLHTIDQEYFQWIWNLASLHISHLIKTDFDLSDVAFCILSRYNRTVVHLAREDSCLCHIHYFNRNQDSVEEIIQYDTDYLRLTPICRENDLESIVEQDDDRLMLRNLEDGCDYKLMYIDCDAMTTTTTMALTPKYSTSEAAVVTSGLNQNGPTGRGSLNNMRKLFTVLGTLIAITVAAIIFVFFWYRLTAILKRRRKKKFLEQQRHFNSPVLSTHHSSGPRYASMDMLGSIHSAYIFGNKNQFEALIESPQTLYKNIRIMDTDRLENDIDDDDDDSLQQDQTENRTQEMPTAVSC